MSEDGYISVIDAARELRKHKTAVFKLLRRLGIDGVKRRDGSRAGQLVTFISHEDYRRVQREFPQSDNILGSEAIDGSGDGSAVSDELGGFYVIELEPSHDPGRYKVGFAVDVENRMRQHRCSAPFAVLIKTWPCRRLWERTAIDAATIGWELIRGEVFRDSISVVVARCDAFFALLPRLQLQPPSCDQSRTK
jgi:hypothetical protein